MIKAVLIILSCLTAFNSIYTRDLTDLKPEQLFINTSRGTPNIEQIRRSLPDTVIIDLITFEDYFYDAAVLQKSTNELIIYRNKANGYFGKFHSIKLPKKAVKLEHIESEEKIIPINDFKIKIIFEDNSFDIIDRRKLNNTKPIDKAPYDILGYGHIPFIYSFDIVQKWTSTDRNGYPVSDIPKGDIDKDGKNEVIYAFYPVTDSGAPQYTPVHLVIFESYGNDQYRVDWDTVYNHQTWLFGNHITDIDKNGQFEIPLVARNPINTTSPGFYECKAPGVYKWYMSSMDGLIFDMEIIDSLDSTGNTVIYTSHGNPSRIQQYTFAGKNEQPPIMGMNKRFPLGGIEFFGLVYDIAFEEIDKDPMREIMIGSTQWQTNYIEYLDWTGQGSFNGFTLREITPNAPVSSGWFVMKDFDGDNTKEITVSGIGDGTGSLGLLKHIGQPGDQNFQLTWWDTTMIAANCNRGNDSAAIDNYFSVYHPCTQSYFNVVNQENSMFYYKGNYEYERFHYSFLDSIAFLKPKYLDADKDNKMNIISTIIFHTIDSLSGINKAYLGDYEQVGTVGININSNNIPVVYILKQNYPNPFNPITKIEYSLPKSGNITLSVFDITGKQIIQLVNEFKQSGNYSIVFNASNLPSGIYFYKLTSKDFMQTTKMVLLK